jgi:hypothetical protein
MGKAAVRQELVVVLVGLSVRGKLIFPILLMETSRDPKRPDELEAHHDSSNH